MNDSISFSILRENIGRRSAGSSLSNYHKGSQVRSKKIKVPQRLLLEYNDDVNPNYDIQKEIITSLDMNSRFNLNLRDYIAVDESDYLIGQELEDIAKDELAESKDERSNYFDPKDRPLIIRNYVMGNIIHRYNTIKKEKGRHTCYLTFYSLEGVDKHHSEKELKMPLILIPVEIKKDAFNDYEYIVTLEQSGDIAVNPVVLGMYGEFESDKEPIVSPFNIDRNIWVDNYFDENKLGRLGKDRLLGGDLGSGLLGEFKRVFLKSKYFRKYNFQIVEKCTIGVYDFKTHLIHSDFIKNDKYFEESHNLRVITGEESSTNIENEFIYPRNDYSVYSSDATQSYAISVVRNGGDVFLQGPPGTGKSQTIVNLIAQFMAEGKRVLFVTEKVEAINVVYNRLKKDGEDEIGLNTFCLKITDDSNKFMSPVKLIDQLKKAKDTLNNSLRKTFPYYKAIEEISDKIINYYYKVNENDILNRLYGKLLSIKKNNIDEIPVSISGYSYDPLQPTIPAKITSSVEKFFSEYPFQNKKFVKQCIEMSKILNIDEIINDDYSGSILFDKLELLRDSVAELLKNYFKNTKFKTLTTHEFTRFINEIAPYIDNTLSILDKKDLLEELLNKDIDVINQMLLTLNEMKKYKKPITDQYKITAKFRSEFDIPEDVKEFDVEKAFEIISQLRGKVLSFSEEKVKEEISRFKAKIGKFREQVRKSRRVGEIITSFTAGSSFEAESFNEIIDICEILSIISDPEIKRYIPQGGMKLDSRRLGNYMQGLSKTKEANEIKKNILSKFLETSKYGLPENLGIREINSKVDALKDIIFDVREELDDLKDKTLKKVFSTVFNVKSEERKEIESNLKRKNAKSNSHKTIREIIEGIEEIRVLNNEISTLLNENDRKQFSELGFAHVVKLQRAIRAIYDILEPYSELNYEIDTKKILSDPEKVNELLQLKSNLKNPADTLRGLVYIENDSDFMELERKARDIESDILSLDKYFGDKGILETCDIHNLKRYLENKKSTDNLIDKLRKRFIGIYGESLYSLTISDPESIGEALENIRKIIYSKIFNAQKEQSLELIKEFLGKIHQKEQIIKESQQIITVYNEIKAYVKGIDKISAKNKISSVSTKFSSIIGKKTSRDDTKIKLKEYLKQYINLEKDVGKLGIKNFSGILLEKLQSDKIKSADDILDGITKYITSREIEKFEMANNINGSIIEDINKFIRYEKNRINYNRKLIPYRLRQFLTTKLKQDKEGKLKKLIDNLETKLTFSNKHTELRSAFDEAYKAAMILTPCWMMTPNIVSLLMKDPSPNDYDYKGKFLTDKDRFDVVIFDEASQIRIEDAVPSLARAKRFIVIGDEKQLPPPRRFEQGEKNMRSLMHEIRNVIPIKLQWHYRSLSEELIQFSNQHFYNSSLIFYPSTYKNPSYGLHLIKVEGQWSNRKNKVEADRAIDILREHFNAHKNESIGIVTVNEEQKKYIINKLGKDYLRICGEEESFVKNIENVQGDERDVIILSIGYTAETNRFGELSITGEGQKRLNVAVTRARKRMFVLADPKLLNLNMDETQESHYLIEFLRHCDKITKAKNNSSELQFTSKKDSSQILKTEIATELSSQENDTEIDYGEKDKEIHIAYKKNEKYHAIMTDHDNGNLLIPDDDVDDRYSIRDREITIQHILTQRGWKYHRLTCQDVIRKNIKKVIK